MTESTELVTMISELIQRARKAQGVIEFATQEQVDELTTRIAWAGVKPDFAQKLADTLVAEGGLGYAPHKFAKMMTKIKGTLRDISLKLNAFVERRP